MDFPHDKYEPVIGLEVHIQLLTQSKIFSNDKNEFGALPNTNVSVISLGHPGTLPRLNEKVLEYAVKLGIACNCKITERNEFSRKNYFYADLPKGYQITQFNTPICTGGYIEIGTEDRRQKPSGLLSEHVHKHKTEDRVIKQIQLTRIHLEEDAGKSIHDQDLQDSFIDLNRAGVPLLEMVTEPEIKSGEEAYQFLTEVRKLVRYLEICDGNMEEGSMRCDANISVMLKGAKKFGSKVEVKNLNSIRNVQRAIQFEIKRQVEMLKNGEIISQDTRSFDADSGTTFGLRGKELAHDYRYFPEPDLIPVIVTEEFINEVKKNLPSLPRELFEKFINKYGLSNYAAAALTDDKGIALFYDALVEELNKQTTALPNGVGGEHCKIAANWLLGTIKSYLNEQNIEISLLKIIPGQIAQLILLIEEGKVSHTIAAQKIFPLMIAVPEKSPEQIAKENNFFQESNAGSLNEFVKEAIAKYPEKVKEYMAGKKGLVGLFMGEVMKLSQGKADPKLANQLVKEMLEGK